MLNACTVLCGGISGDVKINTPSEFRIGKANVDLNLKIGGFSEAMAAKVPPMLLDLLDIAAYVYAADRAIPRVGLVGAFRDCGWRRTLRFVIAVRNANVWNSPRNASAISETLGFLTDDDYHFHFEPMTDPPSVEDYFVITPTLAGEFDQVIAFSGGLDSLAGAIQAAVLTQKRVILVSHRPRAASGKYDELLQRLRLRAGAVPVVEIPLWINHGDCSGVELTQRSCSFLHAVVGAIAAHAVGLKRLQFFQNGVTSLNLPIGRQVVGARAARTTHPRTLASLSALVSSLTGNSFAFANPFRWTTKAEVVPVD